MIPQLKKFTLIATIILWASRGFSSDSMPPTSATLASIVAMQQMEIARLKQEQQALQKNVGRLMLDYYDRKAKLDALIKWLDEGGLPKETVIPNSPSPRPIPWPIGGIDDSSCQMPWVNCAREIAPVCKNGKWVCPQG